MSKDHMHVCLCVHTHTLHTQKSNPGLPFLQWIISKFRLSAMDPIPWHDNFGERGVGQRSSGWRNLAMHINSEFPVSVPSKSVFPHCIFTRGEFSRRTIHDKDAPLHGFASVLLKPSCICESAGDLVKIQTLIQQMWDAAWDCTFPTSSQVMLMLPVHRPPSEEQCSGHPKPVFSFLQHRCGKGPT